MGFWNYPAADGFIRSITGFSIADRFFFGSVIVGCRLVAAAILGRMAVILNEILVRVYRIAKNSCLVIANYVIIFCEMINWNFDHKGGRLQPHVTAGIARPCFYSARHRSFPGTPLIIIYPHSKA